MKERAEFPRILESNFRWMIVLMATATGSFLSDTLDAKTRNDALSREKMRGEWAHGYSSNRFSVRNTRNLLPLLKERSDVDPHLGSSFRNFSLPGLSSFVQFKGFRFAVVWKQKGMVKEGLIKRGMEKEEGKVLEMNSRKWGLFDLIEV